MPYTSNADLPEPVRNSLPPHAQTIWRAAFNASLAAGNSEASCAKIAWAAVKTKYKPGEPGGKWVRR